MNWYKNFNLLRFFILTFVIGGPAFLSLLTAFAKDEGTLGDNSILNFFADSFHIFRFPTHLLFEKYIDGSIFILGLFFNVMFDAVVIELLIIIFKQQKNTIVIK